MSWLSICFMVSSATPTVISSAVPPNGNCAMSHTANTMSGVSAIAARNSEPGRVMRFRTLARYFSVGGPGRMPGMNPPCFRMMSACCAGLNAIAV